MTALALSLAALSLLLIAWSYLVYPELIARLAAKTKPQSPSASPNPSIEILLSAADEEGVISHRVKNLLAQEGCDTVRISIGCDGCRDATAQRAREAGRDRVRVVEFPERRGKAAVLNDLVRESTADVLVFTDANTRFDSGAVRLLSEPLADAAVGAACGRLILESGPASSPPEALFWDRETKLKEAEGRLGICLGANGAIYAARRELVVPLREDTTSMDDFLIPVHIARKGSKVVFAGGAVAREAAGRDVAAEVSRRYRIGIGAGQVLRRETWLFNFPRYGMLSLAFVSRKVARWIAPLLALAAAFAALFDRNLRPFGALVLALALLFALLSRARPRLWGVLGRLYYFGVINTALAAGVIAGLGGRSRPAWRRAR